MRLLLGNISCHLSVQRPLSVKRLTDPSPRPLSHFCIRCHSIFESLELQSNNLEKSSLRLWCLWSLTTKAAVKLAQCLGSLWLPNEARTGPYRRCFSHKITDPKPPVPSNRIGLQRSTFPFRIRDNASCFSIACTTDFPPFWSGKLVESPRRRVR